MLKRAFDIAGASMGMALSLPIILPLTVAMAFDTRSLTPIFRQTRIGLNKKPFTIYKIKTMRDITDTKGTLLPDKCRTSPFGAMIRKTRLDELPQLFNVLAGDMSLVGPRPAAIFREIAKDDLRHTVRPGLTGPAQINKKNILSREEILTYDHDYVRHNSICKDFNILLSTPFKLIKNWHVPHFRTSAQAVNDKDHLSYK